MGVICPRWQRTSARFAKAVEDELQPGSADLVVERQAYTGSGDTMHAHDHA
jgi:hypothetical protein